MKRISSVFLLSGFAFLLLSSFSIRENPQDPPRGEKTEKHIKMIKTEDVKTVEIDTIIEGDQIFVLHGDTIGGKELKWISKDDFEMDSIHQNFDMNLEYRIEDDGEGNMFMMKSGKGGYTMMAPNCPNAPFPPHIMMMDAHRNKNIIDLADPGIISYDKKIQKNGTEKITIIRKQIPEEEEMEEDMMMHPPHGSGAFFYGDAPQHVKTIKVIKSDDGTTRIFEDGDVIQMEGKEGTTKFVGDDGKVIIVKEIKEGDQKKVEVTVEEEKEKK